jgi:hypothetical protein
MSRRDRRVNLALKWHYLDNLSPEEIRDRFEREGITELTTSTIRDYLNEQPKGAFKQLYQLAYEAEIEAST